jgi:glycosyltransferase involved in cell wall biosynthesis
MDMDYDALIEHDRIFSLPAIEPFGKGHSSMWIRGLLSVADSEQYDLVHLAFEPWALIPQVLCGKLPTVVHGAESVLKDAPWQMRARRVGTSRVLQKAVGVLAWGQTSLEEFREAGLPPDIPQGVIPVGVPDPKFFVPGPMSSSPGPLRLLFVGRLLPEKGILTLVEAARALERPVVLRVLGEGPLKASLRTLARGCPEVEVSIEGTATAGQVSEAMAWSHVVVVPSESTSSWKEQWGRVAVEAMLSGRPTVVSDSGELPYLVMESELVFPEGDVLALTAVLRKLDDTRDSLADIGNKLRKSAERFAPTGLARQLNQFWEKVAISEKSR